MAYEMVMPYHLHMPSYFLETFTEYPYLTSSEITAHSSGFSSKARIQVLDVEESNIIFQI
jgi:hypothetical protein